MGKINIPLLKQKEGMGGGDGVETWIGMYMKKDSLFSYLKNLNKDLK